MSFSPYQSMHHPERDSDGTDGSTAREFHSMPALALSGVSVSDSPGGSKASTFFTPFSRFIIRGVVLTSLAGIQHVSSLSISPSIIKGAILTALVRVQRVSLSPYKHIHHPWCTILTALVGVQWVSSYPNNPSIILVARN